MTEVDLFAFDFHFGMFEELSLLFDVFVMKNFYSILLVVECLRFQFLLLLAVM